MRYWATQRKEGYMMHPCALVKQVMAMKWAIMMKIEIMMKIVMMVTAMVMDSDIPKKPVLLVHAAGLTSSTYATVLSCNH